MGTNRAIQYWVIPPEADAEFVANMEDVLDVYPRPYDSNVPVLNSGPDQEFRVRIFWVSLTTSPTRGESLEC